MEVKGPSLMTRDLKLLVLAIVPLAIGCGPTQARDANCMARALMDVPAEEAPEQVRSKSNIEFGPITTIKVDKTTGKMVYCSANSYCYNSNAFEIVTSCRIKRDLEAADSKFFTFFTR
jgi:hypothetical protein